jgi:hypothetical protein
VADPSALAATILVALRTIPGITVYDGFVPSSVPMTGSYINPYVVLWLGAGGDPGELTTCGVWDGDTLILDFQTTTVGANPAICRAVDAAVKDKLLNLRVGTGRVRPNPDGFNQQPPILDTQVTPARFMLPRQLRLITN